MDKATHVTIIKFTEFNPRKDVKHPTWFRLEHSFFEKPEFFDLTHTEKMAWIYLLCMASKKNADSFTLAWPHIEKIGGFKKKEFEKALEKLQQIQVIHVDVTDSLRPRNVSVTDAGATDITDITLHNKQDNTDITQQAFHPSDLMGIYNSICKSLPKAEKLTEKRKTHSNQRISEKPDPAYWVEVCTRIEASDFCKNQADNSKGWMADYDWLIKPDTHVRVMEGKYDSRKKKASPKGHFQRTDSADQELQEIMNGVVNQ